MPVQSIIAAAAVGASVLGIAYGIGTSLRAISDGLRSLASLNVHRFWIFTLAVGVVLFLFTLPSAPPFAAGLTLGWGFLIGLVLGLYAVVQASCAPEDAGWASQGVGVLSAGALGPALVLLVFRGYPNDALMGCALGAVFVACVASSCARPMYAAMAESDRTALAWHRGVEVFAVATVVGAIGSALAIHHFPRPNAAAEAGGYWAFPALMVAVGALASAIVAGEWTKRLRRHRGLIVGGLAAVVVVLATVLLGQRLLRSLSWDLPLIGALAVGFVLWALGHAAGEEPGDDFRPVGLAFGAALLALAVIAAAFKALHGYGEALALLAALPIAAMAYLGAQREREPVAESIAMGALCMILLMAMYRLFLEQVGRGWSLDYQRHYDYFAVILGVAACFGLLSVAAGAREAVERARAHGRGLVAPLLARTTLLGVAVAAVPPVLGAVWGVKAVGAFVAGLVIAEATWIMLVAWTRGQDRADAVAVAPHLFFMAALLVAIQFSPQVLSLELTRAHKIIIVLLVTGVAIIWIGAGTLVAGRLAKEEGGSK